MKFALTVAVAAVCFTAIAQAQDVVTTVVAPATVQPAHTVPNLDFLKVGTQKEGYVCENGVCVPINLYGEKKCVCTVDGCTCKDGVQCDACKKAGCTCCSPSAELLALRKENEELKARIATLESLTRKLAQRLSPTRDIVQK